ncbi:MAG: 7-carboxy-7-deazaguanine synthase QueE [Bacteroidales bacterium]|jgi:organic radical activating enzyme|nr:7-carboxy-7-deazaguanine synthase QueE [Bacteroidales bacterium]
MDLLEAGRFLPLMEDFYSLQGEGFHTGKAAYFLRIGGCDVGCNFCDIKESWNKDTHPLTAVTDIVQRVLESGAKTVVVTGGEPCLYNLEYLCILLKQRELEVSIETSGSEKLSGNWDWICFSPKKNTQIEEKFYQIANELKVIIQNESDFFWAEENAQKVHQKCLLYLQPEWSCKNVITPLIVNYILQNPKWRLSLQTHKYIHIP